MRQAPAKRKIKEPIRQVVPLHLDVGGCTRRVAEVRSDGRSIPNGSREIEVTLESFCVPADRSLMRAGEDRHVTVVIGVNDGPDRQPGWHRDACEFWPNDLPVVLALLVRTTYLAHRDGIIDITDPAGVVLLGRLHEALTDYQG